MLAGTRRITVREQYDDLHRSASLAAHRKMGRGWPVDSSMRSSSLVYLSKFGSVSVNSLCPSIVCSERITATCEVEQPAERTVMVIVSFGLATVLSRHLLKTPVAPFQSTIRGAPFSTSDPPIRWLHKSPLTPARTATGTCAHRCVGSPKNSAQNFSNTWLQQGGSIPAEAHAPGLAESHELELRERRQIVAPPPLRAQRS